MTRFLEAYKDCTDNFWEMFPYMKRLTPFKGMFSADRSENKNRSSKAMWFLTLFYDIDSDFYSLEDAEKLSNLYEILGNFDVPAYLGDNYADICERFVAHTDSVLSANVRELEKKILERKKFIMTTPYRLDEYLQSYELDENGEETDIPKGKPRLVKGNAKDLDYMLTSTKAIQEHILDLRAMIKSETKGENFGGQQDSLNS